jgi:transcriptional regulator with XRE-family HTH domain
MTPHTLGPSLKALRESRKQTLRALAGVLKIRPAVLQRLEAGTYDPPLSLLYRLAEALDTRIVIQ